MRSSVSFTIGVDVSIVKTRKGTKTVAVDGAGLLEGEPVSPKGMHPQVVFTAGGKKTQRRGSMKPKTPSSSNCPQVTFSCPPGKTKMFRGFATISPGPQTSHGGNSGAAVGVGVGIGVGAGVGAGVGVLGIGISMIVGCGVGMGVGRGGIMMKVGRGVGLGVGSGVGLGVGRGVGLGVGSGVGMGVGSGFGLGVGSGGCGVGDFIGDFVGDFVDGIEIVGVFVLPIPPLGGSGRGGVPFPPLVGCGLGAMPMFPPIFPPMFLPIFLPMFLPMFPRLSVVRRSNTSGWTTSG